MLSKKYRLTKRGSFSYVYRSGSSEGAAALKLCYVRSSSLKIGFSVSNKIGKAVVRNRVKRLLRASLRAILPRIKGKFQMVFVAKNPAVGLDYNKIKEQCEYLLTRAKII